MKCSTRSYCLGLYRYLAMRVIGRNGWMATIKERLRWSKMRMDPTDFSDVSGYTYTRLANGLAPDSNWTGLFNPGKRVRLRFIDAGATTYFDVRIPGLKMTVVQADGQNVQPVEVDTFRIAFACAAALSRPAPSHELSGGRTALLFFLLTPVA